MADFKLRLSDDLAARFDSWAAEHGGRSPALRHLIELACAGQTVSRAPQPGLGARPVKLTVRLGAADALGLEAVARETGLTRNAWAAALIRRRLQSRPTFPPAEALSLLAIQADLRRIGVNVNQIARALNTAVLEGRVLDLELTALADFRVGIRAHMLALREAFAGNLAYWDVDA